MKLKIVSCFVIIYYIQQSKAKDWRVILTKLYFLQAYFKINLDVFSKKDLEHLESQGHQRIKWFKKTI